jgi:hypothetical protein
VAEEGTRTGRFDIQVALKIIRHISAGIYRDRAGALREFISNSFDAQARTVRIETGYPEFKILRVIDDGFGIDGPTLRKAFTQVGLSLKVTNPEAYRSDLKRPIIGLFGIGFLAAAHISRNIRITSFKRDADEGMWARINLKPYFLYQDKIETFDEFQFGTVEYGTIKRDELASRGFPEFRRPSGTTVELLEVDTGPFFSVLNRGGERLIGFPRAGLREKVPGSRMADLVERCQRNPKVLYTDRLTGREQLAWNLGMAAPVRYLDAGPIRSGHVTEEIKPILDELRALNEGFKFEVWLDGIEIRKPLLFPTYRSGKPPPEDPDLPKDILVSRVVVEGKSPRDRKVLAKGYLFYQPYRIVPAELRGLYPRMGGVGVGYTFENRFLSYLKAENPVLRVQVSGELYVYEGLTDALNLDRSGFMELNPEYDYLASEAGRQVTKFFHDAKSTHARRARAERQKAEDRERKTAVAEVSSFLKGLDMDYEVGVAEEQPEEEAEPDYSTKGAYDLGRGAQARISYSDKRVILTSDDPADARLAQLVLLVDSILGKYAKDPAAARREFASQLESLLTKFGRE